MPRTIEEILISKIDIVDNVRTHIKDVHLSELMASIKQHGLEQPIKVTTSKSGNRYSLIYGQRRLEACRKLGWIKISAEVVAEVEDQDLLIRNITENLQRKPNTPAELGRICLQLTQSPYNMTKGEIATRLSVDPKRVENAISIYTTFPKDIAEAIGFMSHGSEKKNGRIPVSTAALILRISRMHKMNDAKLREFVRICRQEALSMSEVKIVGAMMAEGMTTDQAMRDKDNYICARVDFYCDKAELEKKSRAKKMTAVSYLREAIYGTVNSIDRPSFLNFIKD